MVRPDVVILEGARTPIGRFLGDFVGVTATELGTVAARGALARSAVSPEAIDAVFFGNVLQSSADAAYLARHVGLGAECPVATPALTVNRTCGSGLEAIVQGARALMLDEATWVLAGGAENMSQMPYALRGARQGWPLDRHQVEDMLVAALHDPFAGCAIGATVEHLAQSLGISREAADALAVEGQARVAAAVASGVLAEEIVEVQVGRGRRQRMVSTDGAPRPETTAEVLAGLPGLYAPDGVVTAGNATGLNDAGAAVVMTTADAAGDRPVLGRILGWGIVGIDPLRMGLGPVAASRAALDAAGLTVADLHVVELNDSFAVQSIAVQQALGLDATIVNPNGGALALGHPMGATGTRIVLSALYALRRRGGGRALCTVCIGGGQGMALVVEGSA